MIGKSNQLIVKTPEGIAFPFLLAGPASRCIAWVIDLMCITVLVTVFGKLFTIFTLINQDVAKALNLMLYFFITLSYAILAEWFWRGQTIGKRLMHLRVMDEQGFRIRFSQIVIRNLVRFLDTLPLLYMLGGVVCLSSKKYQRIGDIIANTIVIRTYVVTEPDFDQLSTPKYNSFRKYPHLAARLRQRVNQNEKSVILEALMRRNHFEKTARIELFKDIVAHFQQIVSFPREVTENISDEQYVRNIVDILFPSKRFTY